MAAGLLAREVSAFDQEDEKSGKLTRGDAAILRFLAAAEILETDLWVQYNELGGIQDSEVPGGSGSAPYTTALQVLDMDMPQYIHDNTEDEFTHEDFINAYLASKGADIVDLEEFRTLPGSKATGSSGKPRLTNLMELTVDTSWWTRYRSRRDEPLSFSGATGNQRRSPPDRAQHRANRGDALSDLARQGRQCASFDGPEGSELGVSEPEYSSRPSLRIGRFPDELDHARANHISEPKLAGMFDRASYRNEGSGHGRCQVPHGHGSI